MEGMTVLEKLLKLLEIIKSYIFIFIPYMHLINQIIALVWIQKRLATVWSSCSRTWGWTWWWTTATNTAWRWTTRILWLLDGFGLSKLLCPQNLLIITWVAGVAATWFDVTNTLSSKLLNFTCFCGIVWSWAFKNSYVRIIKKYKFHKM